MREFSLEGDKAAKVHVIEGCECISAFIHRTAHSIAAHYKLDKKHYDALLACDSVASLTKFAKKNQLKSDLVIASPKPLINHSGDRIFEAVDAYIDGTPFSRKGKVFFVGDKVEEDYPESYAKLLSYDNKDTVFISVKANSYSNSGSYNNSGEIIEIALVDSCENILFHSLIKPSHYVKWIEKTEEKRHGITNSDIYKAPRLPRRWLKIEKIIAGKKLIFENYERDVSIMTTSYETAFDCMDTRLTFSEMLPLNTSFSLMMYYALCWRKRSFRLIPSIQTLNDACDQQSICYDDLPDQKSVSDAIKIVRLCKHLHANLLAAPPEQKA